GRAAIVAHRPHWPLPCFGRCADPFPSHDKGSVRSPPCETREVLRGLNRTGWKEVGMLKSAVFGLALAMAATGASAADLITYPTSTNEQVPVAPPTSRVNWDGFYAGIYGAGRNTATQGAQYGAGVDLGVNTTFNFILVGAEIAVEGLGGGTGS